MEHAHECQMLDGNNAPPTFSSMSPGVPTVTHVKVIDFTDLWFIECFSAIFHLHYQISQIWVLIKCTSATIHSLAMLCLVKWRIEILLETLLRGWLMELFNSQCSESSGMSQEWVHKGGWQLPGWMVLTGSPHGISSSLAFQRLPVFLPEWSHFMVSSLTPRHLADVVKKAQASGSIMPGSCSAAL